MLGSTEAEARERRQALENAVSDEFRWRDAAKLAGLDFTTIGLDFTGTPEQLAQLIEDWFTAGAVTGSR